MERRFSTTEIDRFFTYLKEQPPIYNDEKVHQIINNPEAKARLKGKSQNLLKFTIMTTIFAVIISAVLWWPGGGSNTKYKVQSTKYQDAIQEKVSSIKYQDTRPLGGDSNSTITNSTSSSNADTKNAEINTDNKLLAMANVNENSSVLASNKAVGNSDKSSQPAQQSRQNNIGFDPDTIKPIDGSQFYVEANKEMLEKLGFQFSDSTVYYQNLTPNKKKVSYLFRKERIGDCTIIRTSTLNRYGFLPSVSYTQASYYPVIEAYPSGNIKTTSINKPFDFELANDTLFPIVIRPEFVLNNELNNIILWFTANDDFLNIIGKKELIPFYKRIKERKNSWPQINMIDYRTSFLEGISLIDISVNELFNLDFMIDKKQLKYMKENSVTVFWINHQSWVTGSSEDSSLLKYVTNREGDLYFRLEKNISLNIGNLVPVVLHKDSFPDIITSDIICWFEPADILFDKLPERISKYLRKEYNYITAEDKSQLVKPECKYFDECKNTLGASKFKVFPNPANNTATVSFTLLEAIAGRITLVDLTGRERQVLQAQTSFAKGSHQIDIDVSNVPEGIYLLTLYSDKGLQTQRLIVNKE